jgi:hypothetical protein
MGFRFAAALVLLVHLAFIVFVIVGALLAWRRRWLLALHLPAATWGVWVEASGAGCPLTSTEIYLRTRGGMAGYREGFLEHYLLNIVYPAGLTREMEYGLAAAVLVVNAVLYCLVLRRRDASAGRAAAAQNGRVDVPPAEEP